MARNDILKMDLHHNSTFLQFDNLGDLNGNNSDYALVVLNYRMPLITLPLWSKASFRICADGGANQLYDCLPKMLSCDDPVEVRIKYKPDVIKGDLDSIRPEVKTFYEGLGTIVVDESHDQDTNDLHKCISYILKDQALSADKPDMKILVVGALGGRLDHEFGNFNVLCTFSKTQIILLNDETMTYLLAKEFFHTIHINSLIEGPYCGLIPLGVPCGSSTTTGLKWNLEKTSMKFGGLISVCNHLESEIVTVESDTDLVWTITIEQLNKRMQELVVSKRMGSQVSL
eukprot:c18933_g1_i1 orf=241-1098(-)